MARFGPEGPSADRDTRHRQLAAISELEPERSKHTLDSQWYGDPDNLKVKLRLYAIEHAEHFRPDSAPVIDD